MKKNRKSKKVRFATAERNLTVIEKKIAPYILVRKTRLFSTAGKWREESNSASDF